MQSPMQAKNRAPIVSVCGRSRVGKTTFLVKLIRELTARGYRVGVIKHSVHPFVASEPGRDTWKHTQAGAQAVAFASGSELHVSRQLDGEMNVDEIAKMLGDVDLVLTEGYKGAHKPKIEISRAARGMELVCREQEIIAVVSDHPVDLDVPVFDLDDADGVATLLQERFLSAP